MDDPIVFYWKMLLEVQRPDQTPEYVWNRITLEPFDALRLSVELVTQRLDLN